MYRINFYPEFEETRIAEKRRALQMTVVSAVIGVQGVVLAGLVLTGSLLSQRAADIEASIERARATFASGEMGDDPSLAVARELVDLRSTRIDWGPKLTAISREIPPVLRVERIEGRAAGARVEPRLRLEGTVRDGNEPLENVSEFLTGLRRERRLVDDLPSVELGSLKGRTSSEFELVCRPTAKQES